MESQSVKQPTCLESIENAAKAVDFKMSCDIDTGHLLRTLAGCKHSSRFLELGTGAGVSTSWILEGMDSKSSLISVEMDEQIHQIARSNLGHDDRVTFVTMDGGDFITANKNRKYDYIFADTWPGKFYLLDETLEMVELGGLYIIDDLAYVDTWPEDHADKVKHLIKYLENRNDFHISPVHWSTGIIIAVKRYAVLC